jgi:two-component system response regulator PilR (NtrC family)
VSVLPASSPQRVLIVDDEHDLVELLSITLRRMGLEPEGASGVSEAQRKLAARRFGLCLADLRLGDGDGLDLVAWIQKHCPETPVAVLTAHASVDAAVRALKLGAFDFVTKPVDIEILRRLVHAALQNPPSPLDRLTRLVGHAACTEALRRNILRVSRSQAPVHIHGETGTGKELVARLIHQSGSRREGPFVAVNCGAIPQELVESELFGHRRGAFTGAVADHPGLIRAAEGGTLFLDEVAELPTATQVKLLRVLQDKAVRPVGGQHETAVDVRFLSATHRRLENEVASGRFREDLYYRLVVIEIDVPPLRERLEDLPELCASILARLGTARSLTLSPEALALLAAHSYPGNVRELENILERAATLTDGETIEARHIVFRERPSAAAPSPRIPAGAGDDALPLPRYLESLERERLAEVLRLCGGKRSEAARRLGLTPRQFRYRLKKLGLDNGPER